MIHFGEEARTLLHLTLPKLIETVTQSCGVEHVQKGGYFRLFELAGPAGYLDLMPLFDGWFGGESNKDKRGKYEVVSFEKAIRLANQRSVYKSNAVSSWQSRSVAGGISGVPLHFYGGAILLECLVPPGDYSSPDPAELIFSFSGLPEKGDEALMVLTALAMPFQVKREAIERILEISGNNLVSGLVKKHFDEEESEE